MIARLKTWLESQFQQAEQHHSLSTQMATAVLFFEVIRSDHKVGEDELSMLRKLLHDAWGVAQDELDALIQDARQHADEALDMVRFTRVINAHFSHEQKRELLTGLWKLAYADAHLDGHEDWAIRKIADLLYLNHSDFIQTKLEATSGADDAN